METVAMVMGDGGAEGRDVDFLRNQLIFGMKRVMIRNLAAKSKEKRVGSTSKRYRKGVKVPTNTATVLKFLPKLEPIT